MPNQTPAPRGPTLAVCLARTLCLLALAGCPAATPTGDADASAAMDTPLPPCPDPSHLVRLDIDDLPADVTPQGVLPILRGFQGFLFVRVCLVTPAVLPAVVVVRAGLRGEGGVELEPPDAKTKPLLLADGSARVCAQPLFFNDFPLAGLIGKKATVTVAAVRPPHGCEVRREVPVVLTVGGWMGPDAGFWADTAAAP